MTTSTQTRNFLHLVTCASFLLLVAMVTRALSQNSGKCNPQKFGPRCRLTCQCESDAGCDDVTGRCPGPCRKGWSGPNCQTQNVVLGMPTEMKTSDWSKGARAADGDPGTCVTSSSNRTGWWRVDMLVPRSVFFMEIIFANQTVPSGRIRVHVSDYVDTFWGKPCTRIPTSHKRSKFACDVPSKGRYFGIINKFGQLTLCEVRVFVCSPFTYGVDCSQQCDCADSDELCNPVNGACTTGCRDGWTGTACHRPCKGRHGKKCRHRCGHCYGGRSCDHVTGVCQMGCQPGWAGPKCIHSCSHGRYGRDCMQQCHHCLDNVTCDPVTGQCPWRCESGWQGSRCDEVCTAGTYGQSCNFSCGQCYQGSVCDRQSGVCPIGCQSGFEGLFCTQSCLPGHWGINCRWKCSHCSQQPCDERSGQCDARGCLPGWTGLKCDTRCPSGSYGPMCVHKCRFCHGGCDPETGLCVSHCLPGWQGSRCTQPCSNRTFGHRCRSKCGQCASGHACHHITGHCPGKCNEDFQLPSCLVRKIASSDHVIQPNLYTLLICCIILVACILCAIGTSLFIARWRKSRTATSCKYSAPLMQQTTV